MCTLRQIVDELNKQNVLFNLTKDEDTLPITIAIVDPSQIVTGITIQNDYPLGHIERTHGLPYGILRSDPSIIVSDVDELHGLKTSIELLEREFVLESMIRDFKSDNTLRLPIQILLSTGLGNVLQNLRCVAYKDRKLFHCVGENFQAFPPYPCLVQYKDGTIGAEVLLFTTNGGFGCEQFPVDAYLGSGKLEVQNKEFHQNIRWAVSGYPLIINTQKVSPERILENITDFRHFWQLPILRNSLNVELKEKIQKNMEFYFGFSTFSPIVLKDCCDNKPLIAPISIPLAGMIDTLCAILKISRADLSTRLGERFGDDTIKPDGNRISVDFENAGYGNGSYEYNETESTISVRLKPAVYPHHIIGVTGDRKLVNISISGLSGRTGVTIQSAQLLCERLALKHAFIFDNGNDVVARMFGSVDVVHKNNTRQTRLTAALHFGINTERNGNMLGGMEMEVVRRKVRARTLPSEFEGGQNRQPPTPAG